MLLTGDSVKVHEDVLRQVAAWNKMRCTKLSQNQMTDMCRVLDSLSDYCHAPHDPLLAHTVNQNIITSHSQSL